MKKKSLLLSTLMLLGTGCSTHKKEISNETFKMESSQLNYNASERVPLQRVQQQADRLNTFSLSLFREIGASGGSTVTENLIISPFSVRSALAMLYPATEKNSHIQKELAQALSFNAAEEELLPEIKSLALTIEDAFAKQPTGKFLKYRMLNQVFTDSRLQIFPSFLDALKTYLNAGVGKLNFQGNPEQSKDIINAYVTKNTNSLITDLLPPKAIKSDTTSVLINTVYMLADWETKFEKKSTRPEPFTSADGKTKNVDTMVQQTSLDYYGDQNFHAVSKPYAGNKVAMLVIVPKEGININDIENNLTSTQFSQIIKDMKSQDVVYRLPKFKLEWGSESLLKPLKNLGMSEIFSGSDCFPRMLNVPSCISEVFHKAKFIVDEKGTEAAAATAVILVESSLKNVQPPIEVKVNRPSAFFIYEKSTGAILFAGRIAEL
jgi:serpin B